MNVTANGGTTPFSSASDTASLVVGDVNDAPVLTPTGSQNLTGTDENTVSPGMTVSSIVVATITDVDANAVEDSFPGVPVVAVIPVIRDGAAEAGLEAQERSA